MGLYEREQIDQIVQKIQEEDYNLTEKISQSKKENYNAMLESFKLKEDKKLKDKQLEDEEVMKMINWQKEQDERLRKAEEERAKVEEKKNLLYERLKQEELSRQLEKDYQQKFQMDLYEAIYEENEALKEKNLCDKEQRQMRELNEARQRM